MHEVLVCVLYMLATSLYRKDEGHNQPKNVEVLVIYSYVLLFVRQMILVITMKKMKMMLVRLLLSREFRGNAKIMVKESIGTAVCVCVYIIS